MPFIDIRVAGTVTREQRSAIVADVTRSMVERLGKPASAVQVCILEVPTDSYGSNGILIADRQAAPVQGDAPADGAG